MQKVSSYQQSGLGWLVSVCVYVLLVLRQSPDVPHVGLKPVVLCFCLPESVSEDGVADMHHLVQLILVVLVCY